MVEVTRELMVPGTRVEFRTPDLLDEENRRVNINMTGTVEHWDYSERLKSPVVLVKWDDKEFQDDITKAGAYAYLPSVLRVIKETKDEPWTHPRESA